MRWWPTVRDTIVVLAGGRAALGWAALGSYLKKCLFLAPWKISGMINI